MKNNDLICIQAVELKSWFQVSITDKNKRQRLVVSLNNR